jgi:hypothetical protein
MTRRSVSALAAAAGMVLAFWGFVVALGLLCDGGLVR